MKDSTKTGYSTIDESNVLSEQRESKEQDSTTYSVYILRSSTNQLYIGQTSNLQNREKQQISKSPKAAKFIRDGQDWRLVYSEEYNSRIEAMRREKQLKGWTHTKKEALIKGDLELLKTL